MLFSEFRNKRLEELRAEARGNVGYDFTTGLEDLWKVFGDSPPKSMIEIGCKHGVSTEIWLLHCPNVIACDPWLHEDIFNDFKARCSSYPNLTIVRGRSPWQLQLLPKVDFIYIDGDHTDHCVRLDIEAAIWRTNRPGWIGGHDGNLAAVRRSINDLIMELRTDLITFNDSSWLMKVEHDRIMSGAFPLERSYGEGIHTPEQYTNSKNLERDKSIPGEYLPFMITDEYYEHYKS